jgi:hypothetical protein
MGEIDTVECLLKRTRHCFEIAGTTRDTIEDELVIGGIGFRSIRQEFVKPRCGRKHRYP